MFEALTRGRWSRALTVASIVVGAVASSTAHALDVVSSVPTVTLQQALSYARDRQPRIKSALAE